MTDFTHIDSNGHVQMVDVTEKNHTERTAIAEGFVHLSHETLEKIISQKVKKGNVLETARIAGIMGAKKTADLIPMCHPLNLTYVKIDFFPDTEKNTIRIQSEARLVGQTGVEMEALTAVSVSALTIYDMVKSYDKGVFFSDIRLLKKTGGKSGTFIKQ
ncbi:MAG: cyclic pyranopterin monophosphate synthase MoaC [Proteobacteria bacterium]|nr:cyclic pyranopterin monophosphate synthase MoaC [Pseudomonadota bacterium]